MAFKLLVRAQQRWRRLNGAQLPLVQAGVTYVDGERVERNDNNPEDRRDAA